MESRTWIICHTYSMDEGTVSDDPIVVVTLLLIFWRLVCLKTQCGLQQPDGFDSQ